MKKINILESLKKIDKDTFSEYDLSTLYESHKWSEDQKKQLVRYISSYKDPSFIGQYMADCQGCKNITESDDDDIGDLKFIDMSKEAYLHGGDDYGFDEYDIIDHDDDLEDGYDDEELASGFGGDRNTCPKCGGSNYHDGHCYDCEPDYVPSEIGEAFDKEESQNTGLHEGNSISDSKEIKTDKGVFTRFGNHWEYKPNTGKVGFSLTDKELEYELKNHKILHVESKESLTEDDKSTALNDKYFPRVDINNTSRYDTAEFEDKFFAYDKKNNVLIYLFKDDEEVSEMGWDNAPWRELDSAGLSSDNWNDEEARNDYLDQYTFDLDSEASYLAQDFIDNELPYYQNKNESLNEDDIDTVLNRLGGVDKVKARIEDTRRAYPGIEDDELVDMLWDEGDREEWESAVEYLSEDGDYLTTMESIDESKQIGLSLSEKLERIDDLFEQSLKHIGFGYEEVYSLDYATANTLIDQFITYLDAENIDLSYKSEITPLGVKVGGNSKGIAHNYVRNLIKSEWRLMSQAEAQKLLSDMSDTRKLDQYLNENLYHYYEQDQYGFCKRIDRSKFLNLANKQSGSRFIGQGNQMSILDTKVKIYEHEGPGYNFKINVSTLTYDSLQRENKFGIKKNTSDEEADKFLNKSVESKSIKESSLVDKKVSTLGKRGKPMYFTAAQLKDAKEKYPEYDFEETTIEYSLPQGQKAYIAKRKVTEGIDDSGELEANKMTIMPLAGLNSDGFTVVINNAAGEELFKKEYRYGANASYDRKFAQWAEQDYNDSIKYGWKTPRALKPYVADIIDELCSKYGIDKNSIEFVPGKNIFNGGNVTGDFVDKMKKLVYEAKQIKVFGAKAKKLDEAEEILYVIKDSHGNQLSKPTADDSELWDRVASMEARGRRGLRVVVYTGKKESLDEDKGQPRSNRYRTYFNRIKRAIEKGDEETLKRTKEAIMYAPAKELKNSEASELMNMMKNRKITESVSGKYGEVKYEPRRDGMSGESAVYANYHLFSNDGKYTPYWAGERPMGSSYNSIEDAVKGIDAFIDRQRKDGKMLYMKPVNEASYGEAFDKEGGPFWYFTRHGVQPGSVPKGIQILDIIDCADGSGSYFKSDKVLTTKELNDFEIVEKKPEGLKESLNLNEAKNIINVLNKNLGIWFKHSAGGVFFLDRTPFNTDLFDKLIANNYKMIGDILEEQGLKYDISEDAYISKDTNLYVTIYGDTNGIIVQFEEMESETLKEASYGGAYDIADDQYFTKEELVEFGEDVVDNLNSLAYSKAELESIFIDNNVIEITITWDGNEITVEQPVDMRRIRTPKDLGKYRVPVISKMKPKLEEVGFDFGPHLGDYELSEAFDTELRDKLVRMWFEENTADWLVKNDPVTAEWLAYGGATTDDFAEVEEEVLAKLNGGDDPKEAKWERLITKPVNDSDGFTTDYSMWYNDGEKRWVFIFGDSDVYDPTNTDPDWETEDPEEARQWFLDYKGFEDTDESLKEDWRTGTFTRDDLTSYRAEMKKRVEGVVFSIKRMKEKHPEYSEIFDNLTDELVDSMSSLKNESLKESLVVEESADRRAQDGLDALEAIMNSEDFQDEKYFDEYDKDAFSTTYDALSDYLLAVRAKFEAMEEDELETADQKISSAATSINSNKLPAIFRMVKFQPDTMNLDYGGGKFDNAAEELAKINVTNLVYDPYNRSSEHNQDVLKQVRANGGADTVTISNVLNVIAEPEARQTVLRNAKKLVKPGGKVYITVYEGNKSGSGAETKAGYQLNKDTKDYVDEISQVFDNVTRKGKLIIAE